METKIVCPNCGTSFKLQDHERICTGRVIGKDSNMGTIYLQPEEYERERKPYMDKVKMLGEALGSSYGSEAIQEASDKAIEELLKWESEHKVKEIKTMTKAQERIETLKNRGIDTSNYFAIGDEMIVRMVNGAPEVVPMEDVVANDPIAKQIIDDGDVFNSVLDGRWIMAQMFHMLGYESKYLRHKGYTDALNDKGYLYQWNMLADRKKKDGKWEDVGELDRMANRQRDGEDLSIKAMAFNRNLICTMIEDYIIKLANYLETKTPTYMCQKVLPYKRLGNKYASVTGKPHGDIFVADLPKLYGKYRKYINRARNARGYRELHHIVIDFKRDMYLPSNFNTVKENFAMCDDFKDAYKFNGAYYTASNMIRFHKCLVRGCDTKAESLQALDVKAKTSAGWVLIGWLKELIEDNNFTFEF